MAISETHVRPHLIRIPLYRTAEAISFRQKQGTAESQASSFNAYADRGIEVALTESQPVSLCTCMALVVRL